MPWLLDCDRKTATAIPADPQIVGYYVKLGCIVCPESGLSDAEFERRDKEISKELRRHRPARPLDQRGIEIEAIAEAANQRR